MVSGDFISKFSIEGFQPDHYISDAKINGTSNIINKYF